MDYDDEHIGVSVKKRKTMLQTFINEDPWRRNENDNNKRGG
jgi:hypothetical protein